MKNKVYLVYYCKPYQHNDIGYLLRHKTFYDWEKAYNFMHKKSRESSLRSTCVELTLDELGAYIHTLFC